MLRRFLSFLIAPCLLLPLVLAFFVNPSVTQAAGADMYVSATTPIRVGDTIGVTVNINTNGNSANSFDATFTYPSAMFTPVRGSESGSVCSIWISQPDPADGSASISCGKPGGFTGTGLLATLYLSATADGSATFGLSGCSILANDGQGTDITGGCSGRTITVNPVTVPPTPPPTPTPSSTPATPTILPTNTPKPPTTPKPITTPGKVGSTSSPGGGGTPAPNPTPVNPTPTPSITPAGAVALPSTSPTPGSTGGEALPNSTEQRTISSALKDIFSSLGNLTKLKGNTTGIIALFLAMIPALALAFAILFLIYRLYMLERRRRRTLDRLFEMELSELAALEGKMDLLAEKGAKGREQYREEFRLAKENILRQLKPDYAKPVDAPKEKPKEQ